MEAIKKPVRQSIRVKGRYYSYVTSRLPIYAKINNCNVFIIIANNVYPVVFASRILGKGALKGGMPLYKYIANRILTLVQNILINQKLSEYHTGFRAYSKEVLEKVNYNDFSEDFIFDNQMAVQIFKKGFEIGEISCPTKYFPEASSINFKRSVIYGLGVLKISLKELK